jgi:hypothetical protein
MNSLNVTTQSNGTVETQPQRLLEQHLSEAWFDEPAPGSRRPSQPPVVLGEFLGDPVADSWLR